MSTVKPRAKTSNRQRLENYGAAEITTGGAEAGNLAYKIKYGRPVKVHVYQVTGKQRVRLLANAGPAERKLNGSK